MSELKVYFQDISDDTMSYVVTEMDDDEIEDTLNSYLKGTMSSGKRQITSSMYCISPDGFNILGFESDVIVDEEGEPSILEVMIKVRH